MKRRNQIKAVAAVSLALCALAAQGQQAAPQGDPKEAHKKIAMCEGCHGIAGYKTAYPVVYHVPKLGGQNAAYISEALHAYKEGQRSHPSMRGIADLAAYYSTSVAGEPHK